MALDTVTGEYRDVRSNPVDAQSIEISGDAAFANSILNIFRTPYGDRSATFCPDFGNRLRLLLQEPVNAVTARHVYSYVIDAVNSNHPLAEINMGATSVTPLETGDGYRVLLVVAQKHDLARQTQVRADLFR